MILLLAPAFAECPSITPLLESAKEAILDDRLSDAALSLKQVETAFSCTALYPDSLGRYYLLSGAVLQLKGGDPTAFYQASRRLILEPDLQLGADVVAAFRGAPEASGVGSLILEPSSLAWVDGKTVTVWPLELPAGLHLVQVRDEQDQVQFMQQFTLEAGGSLTLQTGLVLEDPKKHAPLLLIGGLMMAGGGGALAWAATRQDAVIEAEYQTCVEKPTGCDREAFEQAGLRGNLFTAGAYTLFGLGAVGVVAEFVF